jgi:hypothetical protein
MPAAWPSTLPQQMDQEGYSETPPKLGIRTTMDSGPAKTRKRFSSGVRPISGSMPLTAAETEILDDFYLNTLQGGTLTFTWVHPRTGAAATFRFTKEPSYSSYGASFKTSLDLEIMP